MGHDFDDTPDHSAPPPAPRPRTERFSVICDRLLDQYEASSDGRALELACLAARAVRDAAESALLLDGGAK